MVFYVNMTDVLTKLAPSAYTVSWEPRRGVSSSSGVQDAAGVFT